MKRKRNAALSVILVGVLAGPLLADDVQITSDVVYGHKSGLALTFDVYTPTENANGAGVLFMVSGGWFSFWTPPEKALDRFKPLTDKGFTVFAVRHGSSPKFSIPEAVADVRRSVRFIRLNADRFKVDADKLGVYGASAGGHLSLMLGTASDNGDPTAKDPVLQASDRVAAVVAWVAPTDLTIMVWDAPDHLPAYNRFPALELDLNEAKIHSPLQHVTPDDAPSLLVVGDEDKLVPMKHSQEIQAKFEATNVASQLIVLEGAGHGFRGKHADRAVAELVTWFEKHLTDQ
ncbi:MAG: alpha/beta hydrolase [Fuerstiella sp.]|nr:alpha/beta hydrolase [Fuerstiella sp.]